MKSLLAFLHQPSNIENRTVIRSVVNLRILILGMILLSILYSHLAVEPYKHWPIILFTSALTLSWSLFILNQSNSITIPSAALRESLVDIAWIFVILYFSGRSTNPYIYYYLVITAYSAILLERSKAWMLCGLCVCLYSGLMYSDVQSHFDHFSINFKNHLIGMWLNFVASAIVITFFITALIQILRNQQQKILTIRENNLKNEQLIGLATVSASTVHNLATPLSTLSILVDELSSEPSIHSQHFEDLQLMKEQISRCRLTMSELSDLASNSNKLNETRVSDLINIIEEHYSLHFPDNIPTIKNSLSTTTSIRCSSLFRYAIINLLNNAIESSSIPAGLSIDKAGQYIRFAIKNTVNESAERLSKRWGQPTSSNKEFGLGIGSFLANSTIEQQGGSVTLDISQTKQNNHQAEVAVTILFPIEENIQ